jgi:hypothetical protein
VVGVGLLPVARQQGVRNLSWSPFQALYG